MGMKVPNIAGSLRAVWDIYAASDTVSSEVSTQREVSQDVRAIAVENVRANLNSILLRNVAGEPSDPVKRFVASRELREENRICTSCKNCFSVIVSLLSVLPTPFFCCFLIESSSKRRCDRTVAELASRNDARRATHN